MPWRKYMPKDGKHGPIYSIVRGLQVRLSSKGKWTVFFEKNGQRMNKTIGTGRENLAIAIKMAESFANEIANEPFMQVPRIQKTVSPLFDDKSKEWLEDNASRWDDQTYERYEGMLRLHIWPKNIFQNKQLDEISRSDVKKVLRSIMKNRSAKTVEIAHIVLNGIFDEAVYDEILKANPASGVLKKILPPKNKRKVNEADPFDMEELYIFIDHAQTVCTWTECLIFKVMAYTGFRLGEALAMRVENLNLGKKVYNVTESYKLKKFREPKTGKKRFVDVPHFLMRELGRYITHLKKVHLKDGRGVAVDILFEDPKETGTFPYSQRKVQGLMKKICKKAKLRVRNPHDLRHTYASCLLMAGKSPAYVQQQLGHASISITCDVYGHWIPGKGREGLEEALRGDVQESHISAYNKKPLQ